MNIWFEHSIKQIKQFIKLNNNIISEKKTLKNTEYATIAQLPAPSSTKYDFDLVGAPTATTFILTATTGLLCTTLLSHRTLAAVVLGISIGACLAHHKSTKEIFSRKNTFIILLLLLSFVGSNTGIYKSIRLLPLLVFLDTPKASSSFLMKLSFAIALPLLMLKPLYYNFGASFEGAKIARSIITTQVDPQLTTWTVPNHGTFIVCKWLPSTVAKIDSTVAKIGSDNLSFGGPYSSFFNERYEKDPSPSFQGIKSEETTTEFMVGEHVNLTLFHQVDEFYPGLSLFHRSTDQTKLNLEWEGITLTDVRCMNRRD